VIYSVTTKIFPIVVLVMRVDGSVLEHLRKDDSCQPRNASQRPTGS